MVFSKEEESQEVVVTLAERHDLAGDEQEVERCAEVPMLRKRATSADIVDEWETKRTRSPHPSVASPISYLPTVGTAKKTRWSKEWAYTCASPGPVVAHDLQQEDAPPIAPVGAS